MSNLNMANRQCCDLDIRDYKTKTPWMYADFCNTTTMGFTGSTVYARKNGSRAIGFDEPIEDATIAMTFQVHPFKVYAMISDGEVETSAVIARKEVAVAAADKTVDLKYTPIAGTVFVYKEADFGGKAIEGAVSGKTFTAVSESDIAAGDSLVVAYLENKADGVKKISFNDKKTPRAYYIQMSTLDKNENDELVPMRITAYKAKPQRNLSLSFSSTGDPAEITITCDCLMDEDNNLLDMIEITDEAE